MKITKRTQSATAWYQEVYKLLIDYIEEPNECKAITQKILNHYIGYTTLHHIIDTPLTAEKESIQKLDKAVQKLKKHIPIQYILGETFFLGHTISLSPAVLIPRPETEELANHIIKNYTPASPHILDIGTGSGCIAIALAKAYPKGKVDAIDISQDAITIAKKNAKTANADIQFYLLDILSSSLPHKKWDLIVSNPPYIPIREKQHMAAHVVEHEPNNALFVPNEDPLIFYKKIAWIATKHLTPMGRVYTEIHATLIKETVEVFQNAGFQKVNVYKDLQNRPRWILANNNH